MRSTDANDQPSPSLAMRADATRIARAAGDVLDAGRDLASGTRPTLSTLDVDPDWFGSLPSAPGMAGSHGAALADTQAAVEALDTALAKDADGLYQVAFSVLVTDQDAANRFGGRR
jgi:uncharacterized protein YukE